MNKLTNLLLASIIILSSVVVSCKEKKATASATPVDYAANGYTKALVIFYELDGCNYMIMLENQKKLEPDYLDPKFQKDSLPVWIKYDNDERMSVCMAGETIKVIDIRNR
ncbi:MAG: hypothetical protein Fur0041_21970 [Bacteroidia bacterium]